MKYDFERLCDNPIFLSPGSQVKLSDETSQRMIPGASEWLKAYQPLLYFLKL